MRVLAPARAVVLLLALVASLLSPLEVSRGEAAELVEAAPRLRAARRLLLVESSARPHAVLPRRGGRVRGRWRVSRERHVHAGRSRVPAWTRRQPSERDPAHRGRSGRVSLGHGGRVPQRADRHPRSTALDTQPRSPLGLRHRLPDRAQHGLLVLPLARLHAHRALRPQLRRRVAHRGPPDHHSEGAAVARRHRRRPGRPVQRRQRRGRVLYLPRRQVRRIAWATTDSTPSRRGAASGGRRARPERVAPRRAAARRRRPRTRRPRSSTWRTCSSSSRA